MRKRGAEDRDGHAEPRLDEVPVKQPECTPREQREEHHPQQVHRSMGPGSRGFGGRHALGEEPRSPGLAQETVPGPGVIVIQRTEKDWGSPW